jgi:dihydrolipoamide dehydrogenase
MTEHDLIVIGGGPGGYVCALRAAQLGMNVACIDENEELGGTCLRVGCIPSKALLESSELYAQAQGAFSDHGIQFGELRFDLARMQQRKSQVVTTLTKGIAGLLKQRRITHYKGRGRFNTPQEVTVTSGGGGDQVLHAQRIVIATGSRSAPLAGVELDGDRIGTSTEALAYASVPEHLVVIGAGYIGLELGTVWRRLGARVTVLEFLDRILPGMDAEIADEALKVFKKQGLEFRLKSRVTKAVAMQDECVVECAEGEPIRCDRVLLAVGRRPNTEGLALDAIGLELDDKGRIPVNDHFATPVAGVFAIGDVIRGPMLAHKAEDEGAACAEYIATGYGDVNYDAIPGVVYTDPEIASVGRTEEQLKEEGIEYRKGVFPFIANGRARALGHTAGRVKILADALTDRILGVHVIGPRAGELIAEAVVAMEFGASSEDLARCTHAHPTLSEAIKEAALAVDGRALHI